MNIAVLTEALESFLLASQGDLGILQKKLL